MRQNGVRSDVRFPYASKRTGLKAGKSAKKQGYYDKEDESIAKAESESEIIKIEAEKMKAMPDTMEKDEELMK